MNIFSSLRQIYVNFYSKFFKVIKTPVDQQPTLQEKIKDQMKLYEKVEFTGMRFKGIIKFHPIEWGKTAIVISYARAGSEILLMYTCTFCSK